MNEKTTSPTTPSLNLPISQSSVPKEDWGEPVLRVTPIAETASSKATAIGDGIDAFSS